MIANASVVLLSGEARSGKTTICRQVVTVARERGLSVAGVLTLPRLVRGEGAGLDAEDIRTGERRLLAERVVPTKGRVTENWRFHRDGLAWGAAVLRRATPCDLLVIDEIGPLELVEGEGWTVGFDLLRASGYRFALVTVRSGLITPFCERLKGIEPLVLTVTPANRDILPVKITALLRPARL